MTILWNLIGKVLLSIVFMLYDCVEKKGLAESTQIPRHRQHLMSLLSAIFRYFQELTSNTMTLTAFKLINHKKKAGSNSSGESEQRQVR
jgi:hypothetical protein